MGWRPPSKVKHINLLTNNPNHYYKWKKLIVYWKIRESEKILLEKEVLQDDMKYWEMGLAFDNTSRCQDKSPENRHFNISQKPPNWSLQLKAWEVFDKS